MRVLIACEFSGVVRDAFIERGHNAYSCDILPGEGKYSGNHYQTPIINILYEKWDLMIAHPPCTRLANSGVRWLSERNLWEELENAIGFFNDLNGCGIPKIAVENPIPHKYARDGFEYAHGDDFVSIPGIGKYDQIIQPWQFGHGETKATCLWLKNLPKLEPTNIVDGREGRIHKLPPSKDRARLRSITYQGIADAMAEQWGQNITANTAGIKEQENE